MNYFAPTKTDPIVLLATQLLNATIAGAAATQGIPLADVFTAFDKASASVGGEPCLAGLLRVVPDGKGGFTCDKHPSDAGHRLIASVVDAASN